MSAISQRFEASKRHRSLWDGIPKPKPREKSPLRSFLTASPPPTSISGIPRTPSPLQTDPSHAINVEVSPLPSPLLGPRLEVDPLATPGARTNAFFESSWRSTIPKPVPAFTLHQKSSSTETQPTSSSSSISTNSEPIDIILDSGAPQDNHDDHHNLIEPSTPPRSQTIDFFNSPSRFVPSPPRSLRQFSPPDEKPDSAAALRLQLARLSPALAQADVPRGIDESDRGSRSRSSSHSSAYGFTFPKPSRDLAFWQPESSDLSRSSSRSSVSGVRRDFGFTTYDPQASYSPPKYNPSSPLSRLRELDDTPIAESPIDVLTPKPEFLDNHPLPTGHNRDHSLVRRETHRQGQHEKELVPGMTIGDDAPLSLVKLLGQGAFSSVWLARDAEDRLIPPGPRQRRRKSVSTARKEGDTLPGIRPAPQATKRLGVLNEFDGEGAILPDTLPEKRTRPLHLPGTTGQLVAVKMLDVKLCEVNDRTRISFVREVEVLRHISHPSIVAFLHSFTTSTHHCLVLEYIGGGELFELINSDENHARLTTPMVRRMWGELCRAVGWLHGVSIVHRDIKLENIVLTTNPFLWPDPIDVEALPVPLVKLTDFGLARFIDPNQPMLTTRCGSESYAAPEIVTGSSYDGRQTDAWACGIVLYALVVRSLPFDAKITDSGHGARRRYLIRIAKGEYTWPPEAKLATEDLRKVVARLLVRDPAKRAKIVDLWDEEFMRGTGSPSPPWRIDARRKRAAANEAAGGQTVIEEEPEDDYGGGMLVDAHDIDSIASQELQ